MGDLKAQTAANITGERRVLELVSKHGRKLFRQACAELLRKTELLMRLKISTIPSGTYQAQDYLEDPDGHDIRLQVTLTISKERLEVDYTGTDNQVSNPLNAVYGVTLSGVYYVTRTLTGDDVPANHGAFAPITIHAPEGTILNPTFPHPVAGGNVETSQRNADLLFRTFSKAIPSKVPADSGGSMNNVMMGGTYKGRDWAFYETIGVGLGARIDADGIDGIQANMTNTMNTPIEEIERSYPLLIKQYELRPNSSGSGRHRGGTGIVRSYQALTDNITVTVLADRGRNSPRGLFGGGPGARTEVNLYHTARGKARKIRLPVKVTIVLRKGDVIEIRTAGGGGYGKPEKREGARIKGALESQVGLMAGYPGSPVAEIFTILEENADILREVGLWGEMTNDESQGAAALNGAMDVGVNAIAVMKSVGLNVAADPINIINYSDKYGLSGKKGGAVVVCGDDPHASSTQVAGDSRALMEHLKMPIIEPSNPQEIKDWIGEALKLSAYSNLVVGYLITTYLAEGGGNVKVYENKSPEISFKHPITIDISKVDIKRKVSIPPNTWDLEKEIIRYRFPRVHEYVRQNHLNKILYSNGKKHNLGFVAAGISYSYLEQALWELGCDEQFPILKLSVTFPLDPAVVEEFSKIADNIVVVEEKGPIIEDQIKTILTDLVQDGKIKKEPSVWGKIFPKDEDGFPEESGLTPSMVIERLGGLILEIGDPSAKYDEKKIHSELDLLTEIKAYGVLVPPRSPGFCAGCPHRETLSTVHSMRDQPEHKDIFAHGDIGCYSMSFLPPFGEMHNLTAMSLGGAAGSGMDPFVTNKQYALMGDSTFFWRGMTAISNSIKEGQDILYIILENKNTAMTGHQPTPESGHNIMGDKTTAQDIESIVRAMGQDQIYVRKMPPSNREKYMKELDKAFSMPGTKVVIADKECGITFHKRKRAERNKIIDKQGYIPRETFINISQEVCENCRECTKNTGCPGLTIIDTDYGEKIGIDQSTCVSDTYCTKIMACPSFEKVIVTRSKPPIPRVKKISLDNIPAPTRHEFSDTWSAFISGVGGMGVGVLSSTLA